MSMIFYDTETTGLPIWNEPSEGENQPHIVQLAALLVDAESREIISSIDTLIKPDAWDIPAEMIAIHGITTERALAEGMPEKEALALLMAMWTPDIVRVGHNQSLDERIIRIALKRYSDEETAELWKNGSKQCTGLLAKPICQMLPKNRYGYKMPKLAEAYEHFTGKSMEDAHNAMADTKACMEVYFAIQDLNAEKESA